MPPRILFIGGSLNQTTMLHAVSQELEGQAECTFTHYYAEGLVGRLAQRGLLDFTILGGRHRRSTEHFLRTHRLRTDPGARQSYDLVVTSSDLIVPGNLRGCRMVLVQEGMMEPAGLAYYGVRYLGLPRYLANTAATGLSDEYDVFCVASPGYRKLFIERGVRPDKIVVTGIPNFDDVESYRNNDFPHHGYALVATSNGRETFKRGDRAAFLRRALRLAEGRELIFKLHPAENIERARREIRAVAPQAMVLEAGNTNHMIANCEMLIAEYSSVVLIGLALGKQVHASLDVEQLRRILPIQNGGRSAHAIAQACRQVLAAPARGRSARTRPRRLRTIPGTPALS